MNWYTIQHYYSKAFKKVCQHLNDGIGSASINKYRNFVFNEDDGSEPLISNSSLFKIFDSEGFNIIITPEYYKEGINWNWQVRWHNLTDPEKSLTDGTGVYGDNNEYPQRQLAEDAALKRCFKLLQEREDPSPKYISLQDTIDKGELREEDFRELSSHVLVYDKKKCICCNKDMIQFEQLAEDTDLTSGNWHNGGVATIVLGYGSALDEDVYLLALCDNCIEEKRESGVIIKLN